MNGGTCVKPGKCECQPGYQGPHCEGGECRIRGEGELKRTGQKERFRQDYSWEGASPVFQVSFKTYEK